MKDHRAGGTTDLCRRRRLQLAADREILHATSGDDRPRHPGRGHDFASKAMDGLGIIGSTVLGSLVVALPAPSRLRSAFRRGRIFVACQCRYTYTADHQAWHEVACDGRRGLVGQHRLHYCNQHGFYSPP